MTSLVETKSGETSQQSDGPADAADKVQVSPIPHDSFEFLDESWGDEFDRRLAAWESESPTVAPEMEPVGHASA